MEDATISSLLQVVNYLKSLTIWHGLSVWDIMLAWFLVSAVTKILFRARSEGVKDNAE